MLLEMGRNWIGGGSKKALRSETFCGEWTSQRSSHTQTKNSVEDWCVHSKLGFQRSSQLFDNCRAITSIAITPSLHLCVSIRLLELSASLTSPSLISEGCTSVGVMFAVSFRPDTEGKALASPAEMLLMTDVKMDEMWGGEGLCQNVNIQGAGDANGQAAAKTSWVNNRLIKRRKR